MMDIITKIAYVALALILVVVVVFGVINAEGPVDCTVISCEETYTLDAKTREMTSVKTVYTYEDGTVEEDR